MVVKPDQKIFQFNLFHFFLILLICVISQGPILKYYFSYEDLALFYSLQFPDDKLSFFKGLDTNTGYHALKILFYPQFYLFNYQPLPYYIIAFLFFLLMILSFYLFVKMFTKNQNIAIVASILTASGFIGVEAYTWTMMSGQLNSTFLIACFLALTATVLYIEKQKISYLIVTIIFYCIGVYFFQFRSYILMGWFLLLIFLLILRKGFKKTPRVIYSFSIFILLLGVLLFRQSLVSFQGRISHLSLVSPAFVDTFIRNVSQIIWPKQSVTWISEFLKANLEQTELFTGLFSLLILILVPVYCYFIKRSFFWIISFFSFSFISSLFLIQYAAGVIGIMPTIWFSTHRFYFVVLPFLAGFLAVSISLFTGGWGKILQVLFVAAWVLPHIMLSREAIEYRWENHSRHLKYFYQSLRQRVPVLDKDSAILITQSEPRAPSPFVSGGYSDGFVNLAGMYGLKLDDFNLSATPEELLGFLKKKKISVDKLYVFNYRKDDLADLTYEAREILKKGSKKSLVLNFDSSIINTTGLDVLSITPAYLDLFVNVTPDLLMVNTRTTSTEKDLEIPEDRLKKYFSIWVDENQRMKKTRTTSPQKSLSGEHEATDIIDGKYETTWIPSRWEDKGVSILVDLGEIRRYNQLVWSSSRTSTWYVRLPMEYEIQVSIDGINFTTVKKEDNAPVLKTGDFFIDDFPLQEVRYIKLIISKTRGGLEPAIDEVEVFNSDESFNYSEFFRIKSNPSAYFSDADTAQDYLSEILGNQIPLTIQWKVDNDGEYPVTQRVRILVTPNKLKRYIVPLPIIGRKVKALRLVSVDYPVKIIVSKIDFWHPSLDELNKGIEVVQ